MHRYERAAWNRERWAWKKLDEARKARAISQAFAPPAALTPPAPRPAPRPIPPAPAPVAATPAREVVSPEPKPAPSRPLNRRQRRAQAAMERRAG